MGGAVALVECEIEVLSGSFAPWMLEKMKNNPYIKICRNCAKRRVYNTLYFLCALYCLYSYTAIAAARVACLLYYHIFFVSLYSIALLVYSCLAWAWAFWYRLLSI